MKWYNIGLLGAIVAFGCSMATIIIQITNPIGWVGMFLSLGGVCAFCMCAAVDFSSIGDK